MYLYISTYHTHISTHIYLSLYDIIRYEYHYYLSIEQKKRGFNHQIVAAPPAFAPRPAEAGRTARDARVWRAASRAWCRTWPSQVFATEQEEFTEKTGGLEGKNEELRRKIYDLNHRSYQRV